MSQESRGGQCAERRVQAQPVFGKDVGNLPCGVGKPAGGIDGDAAGSGEMGCPETEGGVGKHMMAAERHEIEIDHVGVGRVVCDERG